MKRFWKNKKVVASIALMHHTRFIIPIMEKLAEMGARIQYIVGQAERSQEITAVNCDIPYNHVFDYVKAGDRPEVREHYRRLKQVFEKAFLKSNRLGVQMLTVADKTLYATATEYVGYKNFIDTEKPDLCLALHETNRWGKMLGFWAKKRSTPFITLQEGLGYNEDFGYIGHAQFSTLNLVWGERIRNKLAGFEAPKDRIIPVGNTHIAQEIKHQRGSDLDEKLRKKYNCGKKSLILLIFSATIPSPEKMAALFQYVNQSRNTLLFIKFHPATPERKITEWQEGVSQSHPENIVYIHEQESVYTLIHACSLIALSEPSTTGIEAVAFGKTLVQLDLQLSYEAPYSYVENKVAKLLSPEVLADYLKNGRLKELESKPADIAAFMTNELSSTANAVGTVVDISRQTISANRFSPEPLGWEPGSPFYNWSIIICVKDDAELLLKQLELVACHSDETDSWEVILVKPDSVSRDTRAVLDSLSGNVRIINSDLRQWDMPGLMNLGARQATGKTLIFLSPGIAPTGDWLPAIRNGIDRFGSSSIFGGIVKNQFNNIVHAGMVVDTNFSPVPAYRHLDEFFPAANQTRRFQMVDLALAIDRNRFLHLSGFSSRAGNYCLLDLCLHAALTENSSHQAVLLSDLRLLKLDNNDTEYDPAHAIHFHSRWSGHLWDSEKKLYRTDGVSDLQLDAARMSRAIATAAG